MPFDPKAFGTLIRTSRQDAKRGRDSLADAINISKSTIQSWEEGKKVPRVDNLAKMAEEVPGLGRALSVFFLQLESDGSGHEGTHETSDDDISSLRRAPPVATTSPQHSSSSKGGDRGEPGALSAAFHDDSPDALRDLASAFITVGSRLEYLARQREAASPPQPIRGPRRPKSPRGKRST